MRANGEGRRMLRCALAFLFVLGAAGGARAQVAGLNSLAVLDLTSTARTAALGMDYLPLYGDDLTVGIDNPSLLRREMGGTAVLSVVPMFSGGTMGSLTYAHTFSRIGTVSFGFHFFDYGRFEEYDEEENHLGHFRAADYALVVGWGMWVDSCFSIGANLKPIISQLEGYTALAVAIDVAGSYVSPDRSFAATLMARNIGAQLMTYDDEVEGLPFELSAEVSYKLRNAPFRLFMAATELQRWDLRYDDPLNPTTEVDPFTGEVNEESWLAGTADNLMRHTVFGLELNLGQSLFARVGYNYRRAAEMKGADTFNMSGFSFGAGLRTKKFEFGYSRRDYHQTQALNYFTLSYRF